MTTFTPQPAGDEDREDSQPLGDTTPGRRYRVTWTETSTREVELTEAELAECCRHGGAAGLADGLALIDDDDIAEGEFNRDDIHVTRLADVEQQPTPVIAVIRDGVYGELPIYDGRPIGDTMRVGGVYDAEAVAARLAGTEHASQPDTPRMYFAAYGSPFSLPGQVAFLALGDSGGDLLIAGSDDVGQPDWADASLADPRGISDAEWQMCGAFIRALQAAAAVEAGRH